MKKAILAATTAFVLASGGIALANGFWTNGLTASIGPRGNETIPADVGLPNSANGAAPQSVALSAAQIAGLSVAIAANTGSTSSHAVTINKMNFALTTESLSTAVAATETITVTNSVVAATSSIQCSDMRQVSDVTAARFVTSAITPAAGSFTIAFYNNGTAAASGTWAFGCSVYNN